MKENAEKVDAIVSKTPFLKNRGISINTHEISGWIQLVEWENRDKSTKEVAEMISPKLSMISGVPCHATAGYGSSDKESVHFVLMTNQSYEYLERLGHGFMGKIMREYRGLLPGLTTSLLPAQQEYVVDINRDKAASLGVQVEDIVTTIECFVRGRKAGNVQREAKRDELFVQSEIGLRRTPEDLSRMLVKSRLTSKNDPNQIRMVPISELISIRERQSPSSLNHYNQMLAVTVNGDIARGYNLGKVVKDLEEMKAKELPDTIQMSFSDATKNYLEESQQIVMMFLLALVFVFLVLAAQFESFIDPFVIMFSVPFSLTGAIVTLFAVPGCSLNIYSKVGLVTLIGLITKHGILIVDFANMLREQGKSAIDAVRDAAALRLRPILMTTFAMVIGTVPLALAFGAGAAARRQIGWAIVGGMSFGTLCTLFIVPIVYLLLSKYKTHTTIDE
jgi:multidrug efflux pump